LLIFFTLLLTFFSFVRLPVFAGRDFGMGWEAPDAVVTREEASSGGSSSSNDDDEEQTEDSDYWEDQRKDKKRQAAAQVTVTTVEVVTESIFDLGDVGSLLADASFIGTSLSHLSSGGSSSWDDISDLFDASTDPLDGQNGWLLDPNLEASGCQGTLNAAETALTVTCKDSSQKVTLVVGVDISTDRLALLGLVSTATGYYNEGQRTLNGSEFCIASTSSLSCGDCCCDDCGFQDCSGSCGSGTTTKTITEILEEIDEGDLGGDSPYTPVAGCTDTYPSKPELVSPEDGATVSAQETVTLDWSLSDWGTACSFPEQSYALNLISSDSNRSAGSGTKLASGVITYQDISASELSIEVSAGEGIRWWVVAFNGYYSMPSDISSFVVSEIVDVQGITWDSTGQACTASPSEGDEIKKGSGDGEIEDDILLTLDGVTQTGAWDPDASGRSYLIEGVDIGTHFLTASTPAPSGFPNFKYHLACVNGDETRTASFDAQTDPTTVHLGFELFSAGWFNVIDGDVFGGCFNCVDGISVGIPFEDDVLGGFTDALVAGAGSVFSNGSLSIKNPDGDDQIVNDNDEHFAENMYDSSLGETEGHANFWSDDFSFNAPDDSEEVSDCSDFFNDSLEAGSTYEADTDCINDALSNSGGSYSLSEDGVAVVYITDFDTLEFEGEFKSSNDDRRVLFVTSGDVLFSGDLGEVAPTSSSDPVVEAGIIAEASIVFESNGNEPADDTTIVVEGPLVSKDGTVDFDRDRGELNGYPAQVVIFNPIYLKELKETRSSVVDISWMVQQ